MLTDWGMTAAFLPCTDSLVVVAFTSRPYFLHFYALLSCVKRFHPKAIGCTSVHTHKKEEPWRPAATGIRIAPPPTTSWQSYVGSGPTLPQAPLGLVRSCVLRVTVPFGCCCLVRHKPAWGPLSFREDLGSGQLAQMVANSGLGVALGWLTTAVRRFVPWSRALSFVRSPLKPQAH